MPQKKKKEKVTSPAVTPTARRKKDKFKPTLYINGVAYEFGIECGFCAAGRALFHCPDCPEFLCAGCDEKIHSHKKHQHHVRKRIPRYDMDGAADRIKDFFRYLIAREILRAKCRERFERFYDPASKRHYYFDKRTRAAQWTKPYCLKSTELRPPLTPDQGARRIQSFLRTCVARKMMRNLTHEMFERIYDPVRKRCFYFFTGGATYVAKVRWQRPPFLYKQNDEIKLKRTDHIAAMRIQYHWRKFLIRRLLRRLVRRDFKRVLDPITADYCYWMPDGNYLRHTPYLLGSEKWEPDNMMLWSEQQVKVFLRRLGMKDYTKCVDEFHVDGSLLLACEDLDFRLIGIESALDVKKIRTAIKKTHRPGEDTSVETSVWARRNQIRAIYEANKAAVVLQKTVRAYLAAKKFRNFRSRLAALRSRQRMLREIVPRGLWYTRLVPPFTPAKLKAFGSRRPFRGAYGWGAWGSKEGWRPALSAEDTTALGGLEPDGHDSRFWVKKLNTANINEANKR